MKTTRKVLLAGGTALGLAMASSPALASPTDNIDPNAPAAVPNGGTLCADGTSDPGYVLADTPSSGYTTTVVCADQDVTQSYDTFDPFDLEGFAGLADPPNASTLANGGFSSESGNANSSYQAVIETSQVYDVDPGPATPVGGPTNGPLTATGSAAVTDYNYTASYQTGTQVLYYSTYEVNDGGDGGTDGIGSSTTSLQTAGRSAWSTDTGTSTFDPGTGDVTYTPTAGAYNNQDVNGNTVGEYDDTGNTSETSQTATGFTVTGNVGGNVTTTTFDVNGVSSTGNVHIQGGGNSYIDLNTNDDLILHGGSASTTVTINNAGISVVDSGFGQTFTLGNTGDGTFAGNVSAVNGNFSGNVGVGGNATVTGQTTTGSLHVLGTSRLDGNVYVDGRLDVDQNAQFDANVNVDGNATVGGNLGVTGLTSTNGIVNTGDIQTTTLNTTGDATIGDDLHVLGTSRLDGNVYVDGRLDVDQNAQFDANVNVDGTITGGNATGNNVIGGNQATSSTLAAGTSYVKVNTGNVVIHGGTSSTTVTVANNGVQINDTTNGNTLLIDNTGAISNNGTANGGAVTVSDDLTVYGSLNVIAGGGTNNINGTNNNINANGTGGSNNVNANGTNGKVNLNATGTGGSINLTSANTNVSGVLTVGGLVNANGGIATNGANIAVGTGRITAGTITINGSNGNKISGLANATLSGTSTEAVTGQQLYATNNALSALDAREAAHFSQLMDRADKAYQGVAMNFALNAAPLSLDNGEGGITGGVGYFQGEWAGAVKAQYVTDSGIGVGVNVGFSEDAVGGGVGASIKF